MIRRLGQSISRNFVLMILGKYPGPRTPDVFDVMGKQPHLTMRQAHWKVYGREIIASWILRILFVVVVILLIYKFA
jgi:hypothetical protein